MTKSHYSIIVIAILSIQGCSQRAWYHSFQQMQRDECYRGPESELEDCLKAVNVSFDDYKRQRNAMKSDDDFPLSP